MVARGQCSIYSIFIEHITSTYRSLPEFLRVILFAKTLLVATKFGFAVANPLRK